VLEADLAGLLGDAGQPLDEPGADVENGFC
jgi:hypothetical protein